MPSRASISTPSIRVSPFGDRRTNCRIGCSVQQEYMIRPGFGSEAAISDRVCAPRAGGYRPPRSQSFDGERRRGGGSVADLEEIRDLTLEFGARRRPFSVANDRERLSLFHTVANGLFHQESGG